MNSADKCCGSFTVNAKIKKPSWQLFIAEKEVFNDNNNSTYKISFNDVCEYKFNISIHTACNQKNKIFKNIDHKFHLKADLCNV